MKALLFLFEICRNLTFMTAIVGALYSRIAPPNDEMLKRAVIVVFIATVFEILRVATKVCVKK